MIRIINDKCDFCGTCVAMCPPDAIELAEARIEIIHERCTDCKLCVWICPVEALALEECLVQFNDRSASLALQ